MHVPWEIRGVVWRAVAGHGGFPIDNVEQVVRDLYNLLDVLGRVGLVGLRFKILLRPLPAVADRR